MINLKKLQEETEAQIVLLAHKNGTIIESLNTEYGENIALMTEASLSMCGDLLKDVAGGNIKQLIARSDKNYIIANKIESDLIVLIVSDKLPKFGLVMKHMNSLK